MRHLGAYIEDQRGRYGLSVARLADAVGVSLSRIALIESDHANVSSNFLLGEIAEALDAPLQALLIAVGRLPRHRHGASGACHAPPTGLVSSREHSVGRS